MFDRIVMASEALRRGMMQTRGTLIPALCGCRACGTQFAIAAPTLGVCAACGAEMTPLDPRRPAPVPEQQVPTRNAA